MQKKITLTLILFISCFTIEAQLQKKMDSLMKTIAKQNKQKLSKIIDKELPDMEVKTITGRKIKTSQLKGKPTLINFWFTGCQPCIDELPILNKLQKKYNQEVNFISITYDKKEDVLLFLKQHKFDFTHIINANNFIKEVEVPWYPLTLITDKNLIVKFRQGKFPIDSKKSNEVVSKIESILNRYK